MKNKTFSILIPALNEENNIGKLLSDILEQKKEAPMVLEKVLVISDGSTDATSDIVTALAKKNPAIELLINEKRLGKIFSLAHGFEKLGTDYVILFDADIRLYPDTIKKLCSPLEKSDYKLVAGNPTPVLPKKIFNMAEQAGMFSWYLLQKIVSAQPQSIYSAHGRILMLKKELYKNLHMDTLHTQGDDQYIYIKSEGSFIHVQEAKVSYKLPMLAKDYISQSARFRRAQEIRQVLNRDNNDDIFKIKNQTKILLTTFIAHPWEGICWSILYARAYIQYQSDKMFGMKGDRWGIATSTK